MLNTELQIRPAKLLLKLRCTPQLNADWKLLPAHINKHTLHRCEQCGIHIAPQSGRATGIPVLSNTQGMHNEEEPRSLRKHLEPLHYIHHLQNRPGFGAQTWIVVTEGSNGSEQRTIQAPDFVQIPGQQLGGHKQHTTLTKQPSEESSIQAGNAG